MDSNNPTGQHTPGPPLRIAQFEKTGLADDLPFAIARHMEGVNGYVGVPEDHPLYGVDYSDSRERYRVLFEMQAETSEEDWGHFPYIPMMCANRDAPSLEICIRVHGGLTYSDGPRDGFWWFGFDTLHAGDGPEQQNVAYVESQCRLLASQLIRARAALRKAGVE